MTRESYVSRKSQLSRALDKRLSLIKQVLIDRYGEEEARAIMRSSHRKYEELIPHIPYIGHRNPMLIFLFPTTRFLAIYQSFLEHGKTLEEAGRLIYELTEAEAKAMPGWVRRLIGVLWFSPWLNQRLRKRAESFHERKYPGGYVFDYVEGDGINFDYGIDYIECASCKLLKAQDAAELGPYVCAVDKVTSEFLGWGLRRTITLAEGSMRCDFRFKKGGETHVPLPQSLQ
jgi:hypothetical protein